MPFILPREAGQDFIHARQGMDLMQAEASCFHTAAQQRYFIEPRAAGRLMHSCHVVRCGFAGRAPASPSMKSPQGGDEIPACAGMKYGVPPYEIRRLRQRMKYRLTAVSEQRGD